MFKINISECIIVFAVQFYVAVSILFLFQYSVFFIYIIINDNKAIHPIIAIIPVTNDNEYNTFILDINAKYDTIINSIVTINIIKNSFIFLLISYFRIHYQLLRLRRLLLFYNLLLVFLLGGVTGLEPATTALKVLIYVAVCNLCSD